MQDLVALTEEHLDLARVASHGRSAQLVVHDGPLRQSVIALASDSELDEHNAPLAASLQVLHGRVRVTSNSGNKELRTGQFCELPKERHGLLALEDSAVLLTAVTAVE